MALIRKSDIEEVRSRTDISEIVSDHVTLKNAGIGSKKGLCPFHDERTPSFHVRPQLGYYHCFGCGESGDVFTFLQKIDHVTFSEAVERLAGRLGYALTYEDGGHAPDHSKRLRLLQAHTAAETYYREQLQAPGAEAAREFLGGRGFDPNAAAMFGVGYAPQGWDSLSKHLTGLGFTMPELKESGLLSTNERGSSYDRFRGRVMWPIRDTSGQTIGFGARKLYDDDKGPKYLNTPESPIYHKAQVLYGLDIAKREIAKQRKVVVVEGYTDVMAAHLAGVQTAVATCGTSFGVDHIKVLRRIMDDESAGGQVIFTFDPDEAGKKAAMRAFAEEQRFVAQTFVAVARDGLDPCDLRLARGDAAVRDLIDHPTPMYEFVISQQLLGHDLDTVEGRVAALRQAAPVVAGIRDPAMRPGYSRRLAGMLGIDLVQVEQAVRAARGTSKNAPRRQSETRSQARVPDQRSRVPAGQAPARGHFEEEPPFPDGEGYDFPPDTSDFGGGAVRAVRMSDLPNDPVTRLERDTLMAVLQHPRRLSDERFQQVMAAGFTNASLSTVRDGIVATRDSLGSMEWLTRIGEEVPQAFTTLVTELAMASIPAGNKDEQIDLYVRSLSASLVERDLLRRKAELLGALQRTDGRTEPDRFRSLNEELMSIENQKRELREG